MKYKKKKIITNILILIISFAITIIISEVFVRILYGKHLYYETDKELYWKLGKSQAGCQVLGFPKASINSDGFRGEDLEEGKKNIIMLGDSFTFGENVKDNETFSYLLQKKLNQVDKGYQVINMGVPGYGIFQEKILLERNFDRYIPKVVVLTIIEQDIFRQPFFDEDQKKRYLKKQKIREYLKVLTLPSFINQILIHKFNINKFGSTENYIKDYNITELWGYDKDRLKEINNLIKKEGGMLVIMLYPDAGEEFKRLINNFSDDEDIFVIDDQIEEDFENYSTYELKIKNDGHPSYLAHKIISERIFNELKEQDLLN